MESITIKVDEKFSRAIAKAMSPNYSTKTEFIREAIRDKILALEKQEALKNLQKNFGILKGKGIMSDEEARDLAGKEMLRRFGLD